MCTYKAEWAGRTVVKVDPKFTSQVCSGCGAVRKKELSERWHSCECGCELDRDTNAAINILRKGQQQLLAWKEPTGKPVEAPRRKLRGTSLTTIRLRLTLSPLIENPS